MKHQTMAKPSWRVSCCQYADNMGETMSLEFEHSREAFLAVLTTMAAADRIGTLAERDFLFQRVKRLDLFEAFKQDDFNKLVADVTARVWDGLPSEDGSITREGIEELLIAAKAVLSPSLQKTLLDVTKQLCEADDMSAAETALLSHLQKSLAPPTAL
jgi:hypothetical protein